MRSGDHPASRARGVRSSAWAIWSRRRGARAYRRQSAAIWKRCCPRRWRSLSSVARVTRLPAREAGVAEVLIEGKPGAVPQKELFTLLCGLQMPLMRLTPAADTLEDVFLRCTADDQALEKK